LARFAAERIAFFFFVGQRDHLRNCVRSLLRASQVAEEDPAVQFDPRNQNQEPFL